MFSSVKTQNDSLIQDGGEKDFFNLKFQKRNNFYFFTKNTFLSTLLLTFHIPVHLFIYMFQIQVPSLLFQTFHITLKS
jgi:hypothetical protein